jgi:hypothetical protein
MAEFVLVSRTETIDGQTLVLESDGATLTLKITDAERAKSMFFPSVRMGGRVMVGWHDADSSTGNLGLDKQVDPVGGEGVEVIRISGGHSLTDESGNSFVIKKEYDRSEARQIERARREWRKLHKGTRPRYLSDVVDRAITKALKVKRKFKPILLDNGEELKHADGKRFPRQVQYSADDAKEIIQAVKASKHKLQDAKLWETIQNNAKGIFPMRPTPAKGGEKATSAS